VVVQGADEVTITLLDENDQPITPTPDDTPIFDSDVPTTVSFKDQPGIENVEKIVISFVPSSPDEPVVLSELVVRICNKPFTTTVVTTVTSVPECALDETTFNEDTPGAYSIAITPSAGGALPTDVLTSSGVDVPAGSSLVITPTMFDGTVRVLKVAVTVVNAESVTITLRSGGVDVTDVNPTNPDSADVAEFIGDEPDIDEIIISGVPGNGGTITFALLEIIACSKPVTTTTVPLECPYEEDLVIVDNDSGVLDISVSPNPNGISPFEFFLGSPGGAVLDGSEEVHLMISEPELNSPVTLLLLEFNVFGADEVTVYLVGPELQDVFPVNPSGDTVRIASPGGIEGLVSVIITVSRAGDAPVIINGLVMRVCNTPVTTVATTTAQRVCIFTVDAYYREFGEMPQGDTIGYIEKDNEPGLTDSSEEVHINDVIEIGTVIHVDCGNCTCDEDLLIHCEFGDCDCIWETWTMWSNCSRTCDGGVQIRTRGFIPGTVGGKECEGSNSESQICANETCPVPCVWETWGSWSACDATEECEGGFRFRVRGQNGAENGGENCTGSFIETIPCLPTANCSQPCPPGKILRERCECPLTCFDLDNPDACQETDNCEETCACLDGYYETPSGLCVIAPECPCVDEEGVVWPPGRVDFFPDRCEKCTCQNASIVCEPVGDCCPWSTWGTWSECTQTCGGGKQIRIRTKEDVSGGNYPECEGFEDEERPCNEEPCPQCVIDGVMYNFTQTINETDCRICYCDFDGEAKCENRNYTEEGFCSKKFCVEGELAEIDETEDCPACEDGFVLSPTVEDCCYCAPPSECQLTTVEEVLTVTAPGGEICQTPDKIVLSYCNGTCPSFDTSSVFFVTNSGGRTLAEHDKECKCCTGEGEPYQVDVFCGDERRTVEIMQFTTCKCLDCQSQGKRKK
jgi:hypothetical protein